MTRLPVEEAEGEIARGRADLERITGERVALFAYPNGVPGDDFDASHAALVRRLGFDAAFTTAPGVAVQGSDPMQLPRFTPWQTDRWRFFGALSELQGDVGARHLIGTHTDGLVEVPVIPEADPALLLLGGLAALAMLAWRRRTPRAADSADAERVEHGATRLPKAGRG